MNMIRFRWTAPQPLAGGRKKLGFDTADNMADWLRRELYWEAENLGSDEANVFIQHEMDETWVCAEMSDELFEVFAPKVT
ncbi:hypothetical protein [Brevundimonas sp.]|uniref:hypothetical protein n=1 Tax=Brevundimonas sp. TaxID=1871086 RepID=UPI00289E9819|nr:hypothetical protein [Brevundimonas sp.]